MAAKNSIELQEILEIKLRGIEATSLEEEVAFLIFRVRGFQRACRYVANLRNPAFVLPVEKDALAVAARKAA